MGGQNMIGVSAANRELTAAAAGDTVEVDVDLDTQPRVIDVPEDLAPALEADPKRRPSMRRCPTAASGRTPVEGSVRPGACESTAESVSSFRACYQCPARS
jgi:hypothetical protein